MNASLWTLRTTPIALGVTLLLTACGQTAPMKVAAVYQVTHSPEVSQAMAYRTQARMAVTEGKHAVAATFWKLADQAEPNNPTTMNGLGVALALTGEVDQAVDVLQRGVNLAPQDARLANNLGRALEMQGKPEAAMRAYRKALELEPQHAKAADNLTRLVAQAAPPVGPDRAVTAAATVTPEAVAAPSARAGSDSPMVTLPVAAADPATPRVVAIAVKTNSAPLVTLQSTDGRTIQLEGTAPVAKQSAPEQNAPAPVAVAVKAAPAPSAVSPAPTGQGMDEQADKTDPTRTANYADGPSGSGVMIELYNGNGVRGMAAAFKPKMQEKGMKVVRLANQRPYDVKITRVVYKPGMLGEALAVARNLPKGTVMVEGRPDDGLRADVRVVLGHDMQTALNPQGAAPRG